MNVNKEFILILLLIMVIFIISFINILKFKGYATTFERSIKKYLYPDTTSYYVDFNVRVVADKTSFVERISNITTNTDMYLIHLCVDRKYNRHTIINAFLRLLAKAYCSVHHDNYDLVLNSYNLVYASSTNYDMYKKLEKGYPLDM